MPPTIDDNSPPPLKSKSEVVAELDALSTPEEKRTAALYDYRLTGKWDELVLGPKPGPADLPPKLTRVARKGPPRPVTIGDVMAKFVADFERKAA